MAGALAATLAAVARLDLAGNRAGDAGTAAAARWAGAARGRPLRRLGLLVLDGNLVGDSAAPALAALLAAAPRPALRRLRARGCTFSAEGARELARAAGGAPHVRELLLAGSEPPEAGPAAASALAAVLQDVDLLMRQRSAGGGG